MTDDPTRRIEADERPRMSDPDPMSTRRASRRAGTLALVILAAAIIAALLVALL